MPEKRIGQFDLKIRSGLYSSLQNWLNPWTFCINSDTKSPGINLFFYRGYSMSVLTDKGTEIFLGVSITGLVSSIIWLLKQYDRLDLECHDLRRDVSHLQRDRDSISNAIADDDKEFHVYSSKTEQYFNTIERRFSRLEGRLNSLYSRRSSDVEIKPE